MSYYTNPKGSKEALYVAAQTRRDCCAGCNRSEKRGEGDASMMHCLMLKRRVARFSVCAEWAPVRRMVSVKEQPCNAL